MGYKNVSINENESVLPDNEDQLIAAMHAGRIDSISKLRRFPDIDAGLIRLMIGPVNINTKVYDYMPIDPEICENKKCQIWNRMANIKSISENIPEDTETILSEEHMLSVCRDQCSKCSYKNSYCKKNYINPRHKYKLYNNKRMFFHEDRNEIDKFNFYKIHIKIMLIFQSWPAELVSKINSYDGLLSDVYIPDLANILNCSVDYLHDCLMALGNLSMIDLISKSPRCYDVIIPDYYLKFQKASAGGGGYLQIDRQILESLLNDNHINSLRGKLFQLLNSPLNYGFTGQAKTISMEEFKSVMPSYVNYKAEYEKALDNDLFSVKIDGRLKKLYYMAKNLISVKHQKEELLKDNVHKLGVTLEKINPTFLSDANTEFKNDHESRTKISNLLMDKKEQLPQIVLNKKHFFAFLLDALMISVEYGIANVTKAIIQIEKLYRISGTQIKNAGAILRYQCCYNMLNCIT